MKKIAINDNINLYLTEATYKVYMGELEEIEEEAREAREYWQWVRENTDELIRVRKLLETATGEEAVRLYGYYSDLYKDAYGVRPH